MGEKSQKLEGPGPKPVLKTKERKKMTVCFRYGFRGLCLLSFIMAFSYAVVDTKTLNILHLLKNKDYVLAVPLLEKEVHRVKDKSKKGYYAFLLNQLPANIPMQKKRHEYAFMAARWAKNIPHEKHLMLWIEAGDGFFKTALLKKAGHCYEKALNYIQPGEPQRAYVLHKQAWIHINRKKWTKAYALLSQALREKAGPLRNIILFDMGKIWAESQYFKYKAPLSVLAKDIQSVSSEERKTISRGLAQGLSRAGHKSLDPLVSVLSENKSLSTDILNDMFSLEALPVRSSCQMLSWIKSAEASRLNKTAVFSVLNSCAHEDLLKGKKTWSKTQKLKRIARLYNRFERRGVERWPLAVVYHSLGWKNKACEESLYHVMETVKAMKEEETFTWEGNRRFCEKAKVRKALTVETAVALLTSPVLLKRAKDTAGGSVSVLLDFLNLGIFVPVLPGVLLQANEKWRGRDLPALLVLSHLSTWSTSALKAFMDRFSSRPLSTHYLNILTVREDMITEENLNRWLPLSDIDSYARSKPYMQAFLSGVLGESHKKALAKKLLKYFPSKIQDQKSAGSFLALYYLKSDQVANIFMHWGKMVFAQKALAVELFEKSLYKGKKTCPNLYRLLNKSPDLDINQLKTSPLLSFIYQCCRLLYPPVSEGAKNMLAQVKTADVKEGPALLNTLPPLRRVPSVLRSSPLASDFVVLARVNRKTLYLQKDISQLEKKTAKMVMDLRKAVSRYEKRQWRLESVARQVHSLLKTQIDLFEKELSRLTESSPYGQKYKELKNIVRQWR